MHHVLIVDNELAITYVFERYFRHRGYQVSVANDGETAFVLSQRLPLSLLITDFRMPDINGLALIELIRKKKPGLPAILVSAFASEIHTADPSIHVLSKPVELTRLLALANELVSDGNGSQGKAAGAPSAKPAQ